MEDTPPAENRRSSLLEYALVTVIFVFIVIIGRFVYLGWRDGQAERLFMSKAPALVIAAENLIAIAGQDAGPVEFRSQLDAVKAQYDAVKAWPLKHTQANLEYVQALEGWALAADAWDVKAASASEYAYQDQLDLERISAYLNIEQSRFDFFTASDLLRELLFTAKEHASKGKQLLGY